MHLTPFFVWDYFGTESFCLFLTGFDEDSELKTKHTSVCLPPTALRNRHSFVD